MDYGKYQKSIAMCEMWVIRICFENMTFVCLAQYSVNTLLAKRTGVISFKNDIRDVGLVNMIANNADIVIYYST